MVPAHYVVEIELIGCPDPAPTYTRYFTPARAALPADPAAIGIAVRRRAVRTRSRKWLAAVPAREPIGVAFSGGIDSGAVFLATYHVMRRPGLNLGRLKAFTLSVGGGEDLAQARAFLEPLGLGHASSSRSRPTAGALDPVRGGPRRRGLQAARRRVGDDGARALPRDSRALPATGASCSTATAATRI